MLGEVFFGLVLMAAGALIGPSVQMLIGRLVNHQFEKRIEDYRYRLRTREQAAKAAEYLAVGWRLRSDDPHEVYRRANQVGWECAMLLPTDVYRHVVAALATPSDERNICTATIEVRKILLGASAGDLTADEVAMHAPNAKKVSAH